MRRLALLALCLAIPARADDAEIRARVAIALANAAKKSAAAPARYEWRSDLPGQLSLWSNGAQIGAYRLADGVYLSLAGGEWAVSTPPIAPPKDSPPVIPNYRSPPGMHRHLTWDGTVIEHSDANNHQPWTPQAHQGMVQNPDGTWPKYTGPLAPGQRETFPLSDRTLRTAPVFQWQRR